jgi:hypothetical protein
MEFAQRPLRHAALPGCWASARRTRMTVALEML